MQGLEELLLEEQKKLENIVKNVTIQLKDAPTGTLRISKSHNHIQYYRCDGKKKLGTYINKKNIDLARQLAQKTYEQTILNTRKIEQLVKRYCL